MAMARKWKIVLAVLGLVVVIAAWQGISFLTKYAYSRGTRTGLVRKVSVKGPFYCKYTEGELAVQGMTLNEAPFKFSLDDDNENNPLLNDLRKAEREGARVTLHYRQDRDLWWRCNPSEYFIVKVER